MERNSRRAVSFTAKWRRLFRSELKLIVLAGLLPLLFLGLLVGGISVWTASSTYADSVAVTDMGEDYTTTLPLSTATVDDGGYIAVEAWDDQKLITYFGDIDGSKDYAIALPSGKTKVHFPNIGYGEDYTMALPSRKANVELPNIMHRKKDYTKALPSGTAEVQFSNIESGEDYTTTLPGL